MWASRLCTLAESKYSSVEGEALAILFALKKFDPYLMGRTFILRTDSKALTYTF
jgi:RNase H-like domain found in reverse transcriptase